MKKFKTSIKISTKQLNQLHNILYAAENFFLSDPTMEPDVNPAVHERCKAILYETLNQYWGRQSEFCAKCNKLVQEPKTIDNQLYCDPSSMHPRLTCFEQEWIGRHSK